jgi:hypothetical protein
MSDNELTPEQVFVEYVRLSRPWAKIARAADVYGDFVVVVFGDSRSEQLSDNWGDLLGIKARGWETWQMEL